MKSYTDIEQSRKLAEILPLESADIRYHTVSHYNTYPCDEIVYTVEFGRVSSKDIPCWSLAALYSLLPEQTDIAKSYSDNCETIIYWCWNSALDIETKEYDNPVDACYEMIIKLHEQNLL